MDFEDEYFDDVDDPPICSPSQCGDCWMGDNLCEKELEQQASESEDYEKKYVTQNVACLVCGVSLTQYEIPTDKLWVWPGVWPDGAYYNPIIALNIFAMYGAPKGEVHGAVTNGTGTYWHIWVGTGKYRSEKIIKLTGSLKSSVA
jgi:hypothetical protein